MTFSNVHQMVCDDLLVSDHENHCSVDRCSRSEEGLSRPSPQSLHGKRVEQAWLGGEGTMPCTALTCGEGGPSPTKGQGLTGGNPVGGWLPIPGFRQGQAVPTWHQDLV